MKHSDGRPGAAATSICSWNDFSISRLIFTASHQVAGKILKWSSFLLQILMKSIIVLSFYRLNNYQMIQSTEVTQTESYTAEWRWGGAEASGLTSAFRSDRIRTMHLFTVIWKVKLITPLIFSRASSHRLLRLWAAGGWSTTQSHVSFLDQAFKV